LASFGEILSVKISCDSRTGTSRGYGFVHFSTENEAQEAIAKLNGMTLLDQTIYVYPYKTKTERSKDMDNRFVNVFVKNIPLSFDEAKLGELFSEFGTITRSTVRRNNGVSKGYGFVEFDNHESADAAVQKLNGSSMEDKILFVERAMKKSERAEYIKRVINRDTRPQNQNLYVKNLDDTITEDKLRELFGVYGNVKSVLVKRDETNRSKGFGFVAFDTQEAATKAATELNCKFVGSKPLYVAKFQSRNERAQHLAMVFRQPQQMPFGNFYYPPAMVMPQYPPYAAGRRGNPAMGGGQSARFPRPAGPSGFGGGMPGQMVRPNRPQMPPMGAPPGGAPGQGPRPVAKMQQQQPVQRREELSASALASLPPADQKNMIGERLYNQIAQRHGPKAGKITGMLLEMDISELLHLLEDNEALIVKEKEALKVLTEHKS